MVVDVIIHNSYLTIISTYLSTCLLACLPAYLFKYTLVTYHENVIGKRWHWKEGLDERHLPEFLFQGSRYVSYRKVDGH